ncbi:hypothetical protein COT97_01675 [Candidatus Falkowbacteria bacterium CG10_big_fil_rev_8_21_14_0_10_39_11]|uniref:Uncharacterized protein n=1 Tax=Candidatus Falkowbacteria bacterium CG10_big_fil_rev_8_21_14_0_10_39_11 TaxID=1974565 RepID=A0A2H0V5Q3_9BACT|nr:MAG: hypothetical protein COT97_01675 [Candidatus Falkowbacteria bacterium CG10_big_fil_rev_8_21_14_0_10_39_11]
MSYRKQIFHLTFNFISSWQYAVAWLFGDLIWLSIVNRTFKLNIHPLAWAFGSFSLILGFTYLVFYKKFKKYQPLIESRQTKAEGDDHG